MSMPVRDADLRQAVTEDEIRPGDPTWSALTELQARRDAERGYSGNPDPGDGRDKRAGPRRNGSGTR